MIGSSMIEAICSGPSMMICSSSSIKLWAAASSSVSPFEKQNG